MSNQPHIRFGTDGWRAIIGDNYTFDNVRACAAAVAMDIQRDINPANRDAVPANRDVIPANAGTQRGVAVGYDTRFQSERFAQSTADVIASHGIPVYLTDRPLPTPALSYAVTTHGAACGVMITASHNPPEWNGFKVKSEAGGSAPPEQVERIEAHLPRALASLKGSPTGGGNVQRTKGDIESIDMVSPYLDQLSGLVDIERIKSAGIKIAVDSMHGSGAGIITALLEGGATEVTEIRSEINPAFPDMKQPEPVEENLRPLISEAQRTGFDVGVATDGDADRLGVVAENGQYLTTLEVFSMLFHHLKSRRNLPGGAACTITMSSMMDRLAEHHGVDLYRTPVGFKFVGPAMLDNACVLGGEESGGYAFAGHVPERDGPLSALFFLESMAISGKSPTELLAELHAITGPHSFRRIDIEFTPDQRERIAEAVSGDAPISLGGVEIVAEDRRDGVRLDLRDGGWAVVRMSGTEPLVRIYAEASSEELREAVLNDFRTHLGV